MKSELENKVKHNLIYAFIHDLVFPNPMISGKDIEFCDLFVDFFEDVIIIQCKECKSTDPKRLTKKTIVNGLRQLRTSFNRAKKKKIKIKIENEIQGKKLYDFEKSKNIYPLLVVNEKVPFLSYNELKEIFPELNKLDFIPIVVTFSDLCFLISELDTPKDLFHYFDLREEVIKTDRILFENEMELLSYYLLNNRSFDKKDVPPKSLVILDNISQVFLEGDIAEVFKKKKQLDEKSYWIDDLMRRMFLSGEEQYLKGLKELLKLNRFERRMLSEAAIEKAKIAEKENRERWRLIKLNNSEIGFVLFFSKKSLKNRNERLMILMATAQYKLKTKKIIGISPGYIGENISSTTLFDTIGYMEGEEYLKYVPEKLIEKTTKFIWGDPMSSHFDEFPEKILRNIKKEKRQ